MLRRYWKHLVAGHLAAAAIALSIAFAVGAFSSAYYTTIFGTKLSPRGVEIYNRLVNQHPEKHGKTGDIALTPTEIAALKASAAAAAKHLHPNVQATPQPKMLVQPLTTNYGTLPAGAKYELLVAHDTESPNTPGIQDLEAVDAFFNRPATQASADYVDDATGNVIEMVNPATRRMAWHVAYFNPWAIGVEQIGYASQTQWPLLQVEATARIFAHWATKYGIPIQHGAVSGCKIVRPGIVFHADLGLCGGGHHDPGAHYPIGLLIRLTKMYAGVKPPTRQRHHQHRQHHQRVRLPAVTLGQGESGRNVRLLQRALDEHGAHLKVDGDFGIETLRAVEHFQQQHRLTVDGIVGARTRAALNT